jgi:hypothetical protein
VDVFDINDDLRFAFELFLFHLFEKSRWSKGKGKDARFVATMNVER